MFWLLLAIAVLQVMAGDAFGMFFTAAMAGVVYYMVSDNCANMSMYCLLVFGLIAGFQSLFGILTLFSVLGGRSSTTTAVKSKDESTVTYETRIKVHPFFDSEQGTRYNMQSLVLLVLPIAMLLGTLLSYWSFKAYPHSLFSEFDEEAEPMYSAPLSLLLVCVCLSVFTFCLYFHPSTCCFLLFCCCCCCEFSLFYSDKTKPPQPEAILLSLSSFSKLPSAAVASGWWLKTARG